MSQLFQKLPGNAKVWIYQSSRELSDVEAEQVKTLLNDFVQQWTSHSRQVIADGTILYNRFVILAADESAFSVSGCSIDSSIHFIRQLEQQFNIQLFDRLTVAYLENGQVKTARQSDFQQLIDKGIITSNTLVFNNLVATLEQLRHSWEIPLANSWHARLFRLKTFSL